jgi:hypothetical protein
MKEFIKNTLVEMHKTVSTDQWGQVHKSNFTPSLFGDKAEEVRQYCNQNKGVLNFSTYGGSYGTYTAFTIESADIKKSCRDALNTNENYLTNLNSW